MEPADLRTVLDSVGVPYTDPTFFARVFNLLARRRHQILQKQDPLLGDILGREYLDLTSRLEVTGIQESCTVRNTLRTRQLATFLIDETGELSVERLAQVEALLSQQLYPLGPDRQHDALRQEHILSVIKLLRGQPQLRQQLTHLTKPDNHRLIDQVLRDTLQIPADTAVTNAHARQSALAAWLCYLRQNVGSCFATAPAIIVQTEQPHQFLSDIGELFNTGRLKRTFSGTEYSAPVSSTWGAGDLRRRFGIWREIDNPSNNIWVSPGVIAGLRASDLIPSTIGLQEEVTAAKQIIKDIVGIWEGDKPYVITSVEEVFRRALLVAHQLTEQDMIEYQNRPKPMLQTNLLIQMPHFSKSTSSKNERSEQVLKLFEIACNAFKGLAENALLRTWEFTVASFAETKSNFSTWNLYSSLGMRANEPGGIGECLHKILQHKLEQANRAVQKLQEDYEVQYENIKYLEMRIKRASTDQELKFLNIENQMRRNEFYTTEVLRNKAHAKAQRYANLFSVLVDRYLELFPSYFQEVYDADLHEVDVGPYDDSPAGFRLLFKHGRPNTALWTRIYTPMQYVEALASFFTMTEPLLSSDADFEGISQDVGEVVTAIVMHVKTTEFIESALYRMASAQGGRFVKDPLQHLDKLEKKPWAYTSGGNMQTLISCYYRSDKHTENARWVESDIELAVFLIDLIKKMPAPTAEEYLQKTSQSLLMHSPTHAFLFKPSFDLFRRAVADKTFTYTWVRDQIFLPAKRFVTEQFLDRDLLFHLINTLEQEAIPIEYRDAYRDVFYTIPGRLSAVEFREHFMREISRSPKLRRYGAPLLSQDDVDCFLYKSLPVTRGYDIEKRIQTILETLPSLQPEERQATIELLRQLIKEAPPPIAATSLQLQNSVKAILCLVKGPVTQANFHREVAQTTQALGYAMPGPLIFADTNWVTDFFAFTVNPGTGAFELWRVDELGSQGSPMSHWRHWLDGSRRESTWGVFTNPSEYRV